MSKDEFIIHEWQKDKMDALVKHNELEGAKTLELKKTNLK